MSLKIAITGREYQDLTSCEKQLKLGKFSSVKGRFKVEDEWGL